MLFAHAQTHLTTWLMKNIEVFSREISVAIDEADEVLKFKEIISAINLE